MFADEFLPVYDVSGEVAAEPQVVWEALLGADLVEVGKRTPLAGLLGALRVLPELVSHLLHGERPAHGPASLRLREITDLPPGQGGWVLLGERPGEELALGLAGKFWRPPSSVPMSQPSDSATSTSPATRKLSTRSAPARSQTGATCCPG